MRKTVAWFRTLTRGLALAAGALVVLFGAASPTVAAQEIVNDEAAPKDEPKFFFFTDTSVSLLPYGMGFEVDPDEQSTITARTASKDDHWHAPAGLAGSRTSPGAE